MSRRSREEEVARKVNEHRTEGYRLWAKRNRRSREALLGMVASIAVILVASYLQLPLWITLGLGISLFICGVALLIDGYRIDHKVDQVDLRMRQLDPRAMLRTTWAEEAGKTIRKRLIESATQNERTR